jgi:hypothetical protein
MYTTEGQRYLLFLLHAKFLSIYGKQSKKKYRILNKTKDLEGSEDKNLSCFLISLSLLVIQVISVFSLGSENS